MFSATINTPSERTSQINLWLPVIFISFGSLELLTQISFSTPQKSALLHLGYFVLFNHLHIFLTPLMLNLIPEVKSWLKHENKSFFSVPKIALVLVAGLFIVTIFLFYLDANRAVRFLSFVFIVRMLYGFYHNLLQSYGFVRFYQFEKKDTDCQQPNRVKNLVRSLWLIGSINFVIENYANQVTQILFLKKPFILLSLVIVSLIMKESCFQNRKLNFKLLVYSSRYLLFAMAPYSLVAFVGYLGAHGVEYTLLYFNMLKKSRIADRLNAIYLISLFSLAVLALPYGLSNFSDLNSFPRIVFILFTSFLGTVDIYHYILDSQIFKFSKKSTRDQILHLIGT